MRELEGGMTRMEGTKSDGRPRFAEPSEDGICEEAPRIPTVAVAVAISVPRWKECKEDVYKCARDGCL